MKAIKFLMAAAMLAVSVAVSAQSVGTIFQVDEYPDLDFVVTSVSNTDRTVAVKLHLGKTMGKVYDLVYYSQGNTGNNLKQLTPYEDVTADDFITDREGAISKVVNGASSKVTGLKQGLKVPNNATYLPDIDNLTSSNNQYNELYSTMYRIPCLSDTKEIGLTTTQSGTVYKNTDYYYWFIREMDNVPYSDATEVSIPATVTYKGNTYRVTSIPAYGFDNLADSYIFEREYCTDVVKGDNNVTTVNALVSQGGYSNKYLRKITFEDGCNIEKIGAYAFQACTELENIIIPKSVKTFATSSTTSTNGGQFEYCVNLKNITFQADAQVTSFPGYCFYGCRNLQSLEMPESVTYVGNWALAYNDNLGKITLSNSLTEVGIHFLCGARSLHELIIPASVTKINGSILHGCENIQSVTLLGKPSDFVSDNQASPFESNHYFCTYDVNNCSFYVPQEYLSDYRNHPLWRLICDNIKTDLSNINSDGSPVDGSSVSDGTNGSHEGHGNKLVKFPGADRTFTSGKWATAIFPNGVTDVKQFFGEGTKWAIMNKECKAAEFKEETGHWTYDLTFDIQSENSIPKDQVIMIKPGKDVDWTMWTTAQEKQSDFRAEMNKEHPTTSTAEDGAVITMKGKYVSQNPLIYWFYFKGFDKADANGNLGEFRHVMTDNSRVNIGATRTWWELSFDGFRIPASGTKALTSNGGVSNIEKIGRDVSDIDVRIGIYDLRGQRIELSQDELPKGVFIINGKKVIVK